MIAATTVIGNRTIVHVIPEEGSIAAELNLVGHGEARCRPTDLNIPAVGQGIAMGRAIQDLGQQMEDAFEAKTVSLEELNRVAEAVVSIVADAVNAFIDALAQ